MRLTLAQIGSFLRAAWLTLAFGAYGLLISRAFTASEAVRPLAARIPIFVCACIVLISISRFLAGNWRYLLFSWKEAPWIARNQDEASAAPVANRFLGDFILLLLHSVMFTWMIFSIGSPSSETRALIALLLTDCWWLVYDDNVRPCGFTLRVHYSWPFISFIQCRCEGRCLRERDYFPRQWMVNNFFTALALAAISGIVWRFHLDQTVESLIALVLAFGVNVYVDYRLTGFGFLK